MKKKTIILIVCLVVLVAGYLGYKGFLLFNYRIELDEEKIESLKTSGDILSVINNDYLEDEEILEFEGITYKNFEDNFVLKENENYNPSIYPYYSYYLLEDNSDKYIALFKVGRIFSAYKVMTSSDVTTFGFSFKGTNKKELLNKYNLNNDFEIYKYIVDHYDDKVNIFSSKDKIRLNYLIKSYINVAIPTSKISIIDGDLKGFIYNIKDMVYEVHLMDEESSYGFSFWNTNDNLYFNQDNVMKFISNVHLK